MAGKKTGGRVAGTPNKRKRQAVVAEAIARVGETIPDAFAGDAHALLIATYKNPNLDLHVRLEAAKANGPAQRSVIETVQAIEREIEAQVAAKDKAVATKRPMSELEIARRIAFVLELARRGELQQEGKVSASNEE